MGTITDYLKAALANVQEGIDRFEYARQIGTQADVIDQIERLRGTVLNNIDGALNLARKGVDAQDDLKFTKSEPVADSNDPNFTVVDCSRRRGGWIPAEEELPAFDSPIWAFDKTTGVAPATLSGQQDPTVANVNPAENKTYLHWRLTGECDSVELFFVTYWMPRAEGEAAPPEPGDKQ